MKPHLIWNARLLLRVKGTRAAVRYLWRAMRPSTQANVIAIASILFGALALTTIGIADACLHPAPVAAVEASCSTDTECQAEQCDDDEPDCDGGPYDKTRPVESYESKREPMEA